MLEHDIYRKLFELVPKLKHTRHLKMKSSGFMDLVVETLERHPDRMRIALAHFSQHHSGDLIADPDMEIEVDLKAKTARALTFQMPGLYQDVEGDAELQGDLNRFLNQWLSNIHEQGFRVPARAR